MRVDSDGTSQTDVVQPIKLGAQRKNVARALVACPREDNVRESGAGGTREDGWDL